ncbi:unnamed protein product, partial [Protopolystoma xenopodis]
QRQKCGEWPSSLHAAALSGLLEGGVNKESSHGGSISGRCQLATGKVNGTFASSGNSPTSGVGISTSIQLAGQLTGPHRNHLLVALGEVYAYLGQFAEAARIFRHAGQPQRAIDLYSDLRMFAEARNEMAAMQALSGTAGSPKQQQPQHQQIFSSPGHLVASVAPITEAQRQLVTRQADWARITKEHRKAATMYIEAGEYVKAIELAAEHNWTDVYVMS